ncbi:MAG: hypothetical protein AABX30_03160 [Nanoarchaeota archaeon]
MTGEILTYEQATEEDIRLLRERVISDNYLKDITHLKESLPIIYNQIQDLDKKEELKEMVFYLAVKEQRTGGDLRVPKFIR